MTPRHTFRSFLAPLIGGAILGLILTAASLIFEADLVRGVVGGDPTTERGTLTVSRVIEADLIERHDCWTGEPPAHMQGVIPGHVVVKVDGEPVLRGERAVGKALAQIFDGIDHGMQVVAFCP